MNHLSNQFSERNVFGLGWFLLIQYIKRFPAIRADSRALSTEKAVVRSVVYLDEWSSPKEESKQVGHDVVADDDGDGNDEPGEQEFPQRRGQ